MVADVPTPYVFADPPETEQAFERKFSNYFMFKQGRIPKLKFDPKPTLVDPAVDRKTWDDYLVKSKFGLITKEMLDTAKVPEDSIVRDDVDMLNRTLVRAFIDEDYNAQYWQNQYFLFQWLFTLLALLATTFAAATTWATVSGATGWAQGFGGATTLVGIIVTVLVYIYNRDRPQRTWYEKRRSAESLRKQYFLYVTHMPPYDTQRHDYALQKNTVRIQNSDPKKLEIPADTPPRVPAHTPQDSNVLITQYNTLRIQEQMKYYKKRSREYDFNADVTLLFTLIIPLIVSVLAGLNILLTSAIIAILVVILPNIGGLFATAQRVYDWDHQQTLYKRSFEALQEAKVIDTLGKAPDAILRELVNTVEMELSKESDQWGASIGEDNPDLSAEQIIDAFKKKVDASDADINKEVTSMRKRLGLEPTEPPPPNP